jgi:hypothetical protein
MARGDGGHPGKEEDEDGQTEIKCPNRTEKPDFVFPWQEGNKKTPQQVRDDIDGNDVSTRIWDTGGELKSVSTKAWW